MSAVLGNAFHASEIVRISGIGGRWLSLLLCAGLKREQRRGAGWALLALGMITTIPIVIDILRKPTIGDEAELERAR